MSDDFNFKNTGFWGALAAFFWALPKLLEYIKTKQSQKKEIQMSESAKLGIKNIQEVRMAGEKVAILLIKKLKDGIQVQDGIDIVGQILMDQELRSAIESAAADIGEVPKEFEDLDVAEFVQLAKDSADSIERIVGASK
jgi:hypothetical protein